MWVHTSENYFGWEPHLCFKTHNLTKVTYICGSQPAVLQGSLSELSRDLLNQEQVHFFTLVLTVDFTGFTPNQPTFSRLSSQIHT